MEGQMPASALAPAAAGGAAGDAAAAAALLKATIAKAALPPADALSAQSSGLIPAFRADDAAAAAAAAAAAKAPAAPAPEAAAASASAVPRARTKLLALCPTVPPAMARDVWCIGDYEVVQKLYTGYASKGARAVCRRTREVVVLKCYQLSAICELYQHQIFREVGLHASLSHENVVTLYAAFQEGDFVVMVQEFADGGDLFALLQKHGGRLGERVAVSLVLEPFLRVLQYLHTRGIAHRDIKPENILFTGGTTLKLADFGLAIDLRQERAVTRAGTLDYMAPEVLNCPYKNRPEENKDKPHLHYGPTVDSWAVGVLAYELLVGCPPFHDRSRDRTEARIKGTTPAFPSTMSEDARGFITSALTKSAIERPTVSQLLQHPWVNTLRSRRSCRQLAAPAAVAAAIAAADAEVARAAGAAQPAAAAAAAAAAAPRRAASPAPPTGLVAIESAIAGSHRPLKLSSSLATRRPGGAVAAALRAGSPDLGRIQPSARSTPALVTSGLRAPAPRAGAASPLGAAAEGDEGAGGERGCKKWLQSMRLWPQPGK
ncbi:aurora protein [Raphidocelis subcapitata]|uniref:Aurora protein n=1 Tax=Raphidocelis subcapitata TaxID=307507 RepID=A0A2V0PG19_9CHLO|nr:aurora protein [Raphidocelis subcapitata]|eukprot:GBF96843.1 aurora protein [Raphidocelis subcapitata]